MGRRLVVAALVALGLACAPPALAQNPPSFLPPGAINQYYDAQTGDYWATTGGTPAAGYTFLSTVAFAAIDPGPGQGELYSCSAGGSHFVSTASSCEGQSVLGPLAPVFAQPPATGLQVVTIYRCKTSPSGAHFISTDPACGGLYVEAPLAYATASQDRLDRYALPSGGFADTARGVPSDAVFQETLGFLAPNPGPGLAALYSCQAGDQFSSVYPGCEGQHVGGIEGYLYAGPSGGWPETLTLFRCATAPGGYHFDSLDPGCEGHVTTGPLGYIAQTQAGLDRFVDPATGEHWTSTRAVPNGYVFDRRLGYLLQAGGAGRHALYSCVSGADQFTSLDPACEGQQLIGQDGWAYDTPPAGQPVAALYRCRASGGPGYFDSVSPGCEGALTEGGLGYIATTPDAAYAPPPAPGGSGSQTTSVTPPPPTRPRRHVQVELVITWSWSGDVTRLRGLRMLGLPRGAHVLVRCRGHHCPRVRLRVRAGHLRRLMADLLRRRFHGGQRLVFTVTAAGLAPERLELVIRDRAAPVGRVL